MTEPSVLHLASLIQIQERGTRGGGTGPWENLPEARTVPGGCECLWRPGELQRKLRAPVRSLSLRRAGERGKGTPCVVSPRARRSGGGEHWVGLEKSSSPASRAAAVGSLYPRQLAVGLALREVALVCDPGSSEV